MRSVAIAVIAVGAAVCSDPVAPRTSPVAWYVAGHSGTGRPAVDDSTVYFVPTAGSHAVYAFDRATGEPRWTASTGVTVGPTGDNGCMLAGPLIVCSDGTDIVGLARSDGHRVWSFRPADGGFPGACISAMDSARATIYSPSPPNMVHAIDAATGLPKWSVPVMPGASNLIVCKVVDGGDQVYAPFTLTGNLNIGGVVALSKADGSTRWLTTFVLPDSGASAKDLAVWSNNVIVSREDGRIDVLDRATGAVAWELPGVETYPDWFGPAVPVGFDFRTLLVAGNTLTALSVSGWVVSYDLVTHKEIARGTRYHSAAAAWAVTGDDGVAYFTSTSGFLFGFDPTNAASLGLVVPFSGFLTAPAVTSDRIFIGAHDGYYALKR